MGVVNILRDVTRITKPFPFLYTALLLICWCAEIFTSFAWVCIIESSIFMSFLVVIFLIRLSYPLKYCIWYRLQCTLPLLPQGINYVDTYIYEFSEYYAIVNCVMVYAIALFSLVNAYFVFIKPKQ